MRIVGLDILKKLGATFIALLLGMALLQKVLAQAPEVARAMFVLILLASPVAYVIREGRKKKVRHLPNARGAERTPVAGPQFPGDEP